MTFGQDKSIIINCCYVIGKSTLRNYCGVVKKTREFKVNIIGAVASKD